MVETDLKIKISANDETNGAFNSLSGKLGSLGSAAGTAAKIIGGTFVAAVGALGVFGVSSFNAAISAEEDMERATLSLQNAFNNFTDNDFKKMQKQMADGEVTFDNLTAAMNESANAALKLGYDDEDASKSFAKLFSVTHDVVKSQEELKLAMDLSAYSGKSLEEATQALVMVHAGGTKVLKEFGIEVGQNTTAAKVLELVQEKVADSASTMAETTEGKLRILNESWGNLKETVGATLIEAVTPFITTLADFVSSDTFNDWLNSTSEFAMNLADIFLVELPLAFDKTVKGVNDFIEAAKQNAVIILIWDNLKQSVLLVWDSIKNSLLPAIDDFSKKIQPFMPLIQEFGEILAKVFGTILLAALLAVIKAVGGLIAISVEVFAKLIEFGSWISTKFIKYWDDLTTTLSKVIDFFQKIIDLAKQATQSVSNYFSSGASLNPFSSSFKLPGLATGGIVTRPTVAMIGEGGEPEAVIPLSKLGAMGGGLTINIYGDVSGQEVVDKISEAIMGKLSLNGKYSI